jgi:hypothetical protein
MWQVYLINILIGCGIALLIALTIAVIQIIAILYDIRSTTKAIKKKIDAVMAAIDFVGNVFGGFERAKKKIKKKMAPNESIMIAFAAGVKKGLEVMFGKEEESDE